MVSYTTTSMTMEQVQDLIRNERVMQEGSLRDRFAMAALTGLVNRLSPSIEADALTAYEIADQMLKARER